MKRSSSSISNEGNFSSILRFISISLALMVWLPLAAGTSPVPISLDQEIDGEITAGEEQVFLLENLPSGQRIYLQPTASSNTNQLNWILEDRFGRVIARNLSQLADLGPFNLMGGEYRLTVRGETPTATGSYSFIAHAVDDTASELALEALDNRTLTGVGAVHRFDLALSEPSTVRLNFSGPSPNQLSYRIVDALGNVRQDWTNSAPAVTGEFNFPTGTHAIEVRGRNAFVGAFSLQVTPVVELVTTAPLPLNGSAPYSSNDVSEKSQLEFTLDDQTSVFINFSFAHVTTAGQWRLDRDDGQEISGWSSRMSPPEQAWDLTAGSYILSVRSRASTAITGDANLYEVLDSVSMLMPDAPATALIQTPGQEHRFEISGLPQGIYLLDRTATDNNSGLEWRIEDALGRTVLPQIFDVDDVEGIALDGGDYTLIVSATNDQLGFVDFELVTALFTETPTSVGSVIIDSIIEAGEIRQYSFTAAAKQRLAIERQASTNTTGLNYFLQDALGRVIIPRGTTLPTLTEVRLAGGQYLLTVVGEGGATGDYTLALNDNGVSAFTPAGTPLALDDLAQATINPGDTQQWLLTLATPTRTYFEIVDGTNSLDWTLYDPSGQVLFENQRAQTPGTDDRGPFMLAAGDYTIEYEQPGSSAADYSFRVTDVPISEIPIALDQVINSGPSAKGFRNDYLFTVPSDGRYYFELLQGVSQLRWRLETIDGEMVFGNSSARNDGDSRGAFDLRAGDYRLIFEATGNATPVFEFQIHTVTDFVDSLSLGAVPVAVAGTLAMPGQTHAYDLTLESGVDRLYVQVQSGDSRLRYSLIDSAGRLILDRVRLSSPVNDDRGPLPIQPGAYQLLITMTAPTLSSYALSLNSVPTLPPQATALDQIETWTPSIPGAEQEFSFTLSDPSTRVVFDPQVAVTNTFVTLTHLSSGWQPFFDVHLNSVGNANRGPIALPPGDYALTLRSWTGLGQPSWELVEVFDEDGGLLPLNQVVDARFATPGSRLSYTVQPDEDGQALIFDQMSGAGGNDWVLLDPVGTAVFGPVNADNFNSSDQGPVQLADGEYTLIIFNTENETPTWQFQIATSGSIISVPEGCAACSALDVVFAFDTSPSMNSVNQAMCDLTADLVQALAADGIPISSRFWGIAEDGVATCLTSNVTAQLGTAVPGSPPPWMTTLDQCEDGLAGPRENWGPAAAVVAGLAPWDEDAVRLLIPVVDEGPYCGGPVNNFDIESVYYARQLAAQNDVVISPLLPDTVSDPVRAMAGLITVGTGGISTVADFDLEDVLPIARSIAVAACGTAQTIAAPQFTDLSPRPGTLLPSNVPIVLSGRVLPVNRLRPVLEVEVNGQPSSVLDGSGAFFATIELQPGPNLVTISAVEACGPTVLEIELIGAGDDSDPWASFAEVSDLLQAEFSRTTFDPPTQRLLVDTAVRNTGAALKGPILMAIGLDLDPGVSLLTSDGNTPNGEAYVVLVPEGETLPAGATSAIRELAFSNPELAPIDFEPRFLLPANQAPHFTSVPVTRATVGRSWAYQAAASDGDDDNLSYALLVGPSGMTLGNGALAWTPSAAGSFDVVLRVSDGRGGASRQSFSINVVEPGFNAPPIFTSTPVIQAPIGFDYSYQASVFDPDGDSVTFTLLSGPTGLVVNPTSGLLSWPNAQPAQHNVILEADDGQGAQATQNFTLFVGEPATRLPGPAFSSVPVTFAAVDTQYRYQFEFNPPQDPPPAITLAQGPGGMSVDPVAGTLDWLPQLSDLGPHAIELIATDSNGQQASQRFELTVLDELPNQAPYLTSTPPQSAVVGQLWIYQASAIDPEFEDLAYSLAQAPAGMQIDVVSGLLEWTPPSGAPSSVPVTLQVTDHDGLSAEQAFDVAVRDTNADPVLTSTPPVAVFVGRNYNHLFIAEDADGDALTYSLLEGPSGMTVDGEAGWLSWSTAGVEPGNYSYEIEVRDNWGGQDTRTVNLTVIADTEAPTATIFIARQPACATEEVTVCLQASDNVGLASRALQIDGQPQTLVANCVNWTPPTPGNIPASATATDVTGLSVNTSRTLQVADCNDEQKPVVTLFSPDIDELLLKPTPLVVSIDDNTPEALTWTVSIRAGLDGEPEVLAEGEGPVSESEVALIDPSVLPEGEYYARILGSDGLQTGGIEFRINVGGGFKPGRVRSATADVILPLAGTPLTVGRSYDSLDAGVHGVNEGDLGPGWRLFLSGSVQDSARESSDPDSPVAEMLVEPFKEGTRVVVTKPDGERVGFSFEPKPGGFLASFKVNFEPDEGVEDELRVVGGPSAVFNFGAGFADYIIPYNPSVYELETPEKVVYVISEEDGLLEIRDALGGILTINDEGIESSTGLAIDYIRDSAGRVVEVQVPPAEEGQESRSIFYAYDDLGNLQTVTELSGGVTTFVYANADYPHHVTAVIDPRGEVLTQQIYDDEGRLVAQCPADGDSATLEGCMTYAYDVAGGVQTTFDTRGFQTDFVFDEEGLLLVQRDWTDATNFLEQRWIYNEDGYAIEYIDRAGGSRISTYDDRGNELSRREPGGQLFTWTYGDCTRYWETAIDGLGNTWRKEYDEDCLLRFSTDPLGNVTEYQYVDPGWRTAVIDPVGQIWGYGFNGFGWEIARADPLGTFETSTYDNVGNEVSKTDRNGQERNFINDESGLLLSESWAGQSEQLTFEYNEVGLATEEAFSDQALSVTYNPTGRIQRLEWTGLAGPDWWVEYLYDGNGNVIEVTDSMGGLTQYEYDAFDQLVAISQSGTGVNEKRVEFDLNPHGLVKAMRRFGDLDGNIPGPRTEVEYACESCGANVSRIEHFRPDGTSIHEISFNRNGIGLVTQMMDAEGTHDFVYDGRGWLVSANHPPIAGLNSGTYSWDGQGNWLSLPGKPEQASLSYADGIGGHRLLSDGEFDYEYDASGAVISRVDSTTGETLNFEYDPLGRLVSATLLDGQDTLISEASYGYTPSGARTFIELDGVRRYFVYDGSNVLAVLDDDGQLISRRLQMRAVDRALAVDDGSEIRWLLTDQNGSIRDVVDTNGQIIAHYAYTPFGEQVLGPEPTLDDSIRFTGREFDVPGGLGYFRARTYAPDIARFLSEDPLEPWHYRYAENSPFKYTDPSGKLAAASYALLACQGIKAVFTALGAAGTGQFVEGLLRAAADGINGDPVDVEEVLESIKRFRPIKLKVSCGIPIPLP